MDFLKSCATNVRVVENILSTPCEVFVRVDGIHEADKTTRLYEAAATLRRDNVLCAVEERELWVFGHELEKARELLKEAGVRATEAIEDRKKAALLHAVEASLTFKLAADGLTHIGSWTWLFSDDAVDHGNTALELHASFNGNSTLYFTTSTQPSQLSTFGPDAMSVESTRCLLAPSGSFGNRLQSPADDGAPLIRNAAWKKGVSAFLRSEGVEVSEDEAWTAVEIKHDGEMTRFLWPCRLCFDTNDPRDQHWASASADWKQWFDSTTANGDAFRNPLAAAEEWCTNAGQREPLSQQDEPTIREDTGHQMLPDATSDLVTSPPFNQRTADQQAAMGGIYPTPPDGMLPGTQGTQQQPTSDGNTMPLINESSELLAGEEMEGLRQSIGSSNAPGDGFHRSDDDLFGDMGEIEFGGNEVGDADFDYFDEVGEEAVARTFDGEERGHQADIEMPDIGTPEAIKNEQHIASESAPAEDAKSPDDQSLAVQDPGTAPEAKTTPEHMTNSPTRASDAHVLPATNPPQQPYRPLSPFGIRERLLPPPIPASTIRAESDKPASLRRASTFGPVTFNEGLGLGSKYGNDSLINTTPTSRSQPSAIDVSLPPKQRRKRLRPKQTPAEVDSDDSDVMVDSEEEETSSSGTSVSDGELPHKAPWESRKRKRDGLGMSQEVDEDGTFPWMRTYPDENDTPEVSVEKIDALQRILLRSDRIDEENTKPPLSGKSTDGARPSPTDSTDTEADTIPPIDQLFDELEDLDLVYIAQLVAERSVSVIPSLAEAVKLNTSPHADEHIASAIQPLLEQALHSLLPTTSTCDLTKLALPREPPRQMQPSATKGPTPVPRPPQRADSIQAGPDCCLIPPPYIRVQRYGDTVEMLPPALHFWNTLGLSPASGAKDVRVVSVVPGNLDLVHSVQEFLTQLKLVYEASKLGNWKAVSGLQTPADEFEELVVHESSTVLVQPHPSADAVDQVDALQAFALACEYLGKALALIGHEEPERTTLVCMVNPFSDKDSVRARQALCACFWMLYTAYRDNIPKAQRTAPRSDVVLRILPASLIASPDGLVILDQTQLGRLAMEVYDRCPPASKATASKDVPAALMPFFAAPAVELAMPVPRRIPFQLSAEPPGDLLHENSVLHLAYAISEDRMWMCFFWVDGSGRFAGQLSSCLRGRSIADAVGEAWERTQEWMRGRDVTWRVYVVGCGDVGVGEKSIEDSWRVTVSSKARRQPLHITLLSVKPDPELKLTPPAPAQPAGEKGGQGFLTPVTTPSGTGMTVSPDASASAAVAPPTPAPSDPNPDGEGEAHLVEVADESWGVMLAPAFSASSNSPSASNKSMASGLLFRRGASSGDGVALEALQVNLHWDIRLRPNGTVDEGPVRQAEFTLREILRLFRGLGILGRARGVDGNKEDEGNVAGEGGVLPVHVAGAVRGVRGLEGLLG